MQPLHHGRARTTAAWHVYGIAGVLLADAALDELEGVGRTGGWMCGALEEGALGYTRNANGSAKVSGMRPSACVTTQSGVRECEHAGPSSDTAAADEQHAQSLAQWCGWQPAAGRGWFTNTAGYSTSQRQHTSAGRLPHSQLGALTDLTLHENQLTGQEAFGAYMGE